MMKHLKRFVAITISMVMAFQFCTNDFYLYAETEPADPGQTQVTNEPESEPSDSTGEAAEETPPSDIGTPEPSAPVEEQPAAPVEEQPAPPVEEQPEVASTLKVEFVDANNASVKETVEQALTSKYVKDTINLDVLGIDTNVEGYTLTEVKDKNDSTQVYTTETKDFVLTGNVTELQFVYTQNVQTDQPEDSQEPSTPQGGHEDQNSEEDQEDTDDEDSDSQTNEGENESADSSKDDELAYPEQILSATASDEAIITIIAKEGALPEGAEVVVEPVESNSIAQIVEDALSQEGKELQTYKAYDITILLDGEEIQPKVPIQVGITGSGVTGSEKSLFHIADGSSKAEKVSVIDSGNTQTFSAEGFSVYVLTGDIRNDNNVSSARRPSKDSQSWYFRNDTPSDNGVTIYYSINAGSLTELPSGERIEVDDNTNAIVFYVKINDGYNFQGISFTAGEQDETVTDINNVPWSIGGVNYGRITNTAKRMGCTYEFHYSSFTNDNDGEDGLRAFFVNTKENIRLTKITYHKNDGSDRITEQTVYQNQQAVLLGEGTFVRDEYVLTGWNTKADGTGTRYDLGSTIDIYNSPITLYAQWESNINNFIIRYVNEDGEELNRVTERKNTGVNITANSKQINGYTLINRSVTPADCGTFDGNTFTGTMPKEEVTVTYTYKSIVEKDIGGPIISVIGKDNDERYNQGTVTVNVYVDGD